MSRVAAQDDDQLGPYRLLTSLGKGGMAEVWKAEHRHLGQVRALKILLPEVAARPELVNRLITEARATARLRHPVIVEVFDCDMLGGGGAFIAMEYLRGEHLRAWLGRIGKLAGHPRLAAAILGTIAEGLDFAHRQGVVHRDLKPENVFLVPLAAGEAGFAIKVLDFGIAKLLREEAPTKTRPGCVVGTPLYMAPEQWQPGSPSTIAPISTRSAACSSSCFTGGRRSVLDNLVHHACSPQREPAPTSSLIEPALPAAPGQLLARMLAKSPQDRPQTMDEVITALESFLGVERARFASLLRAPDGFLVLPNDSSPNILPAGPQPRVVSPHTPTAVADSSAFTSMTSTWDEVDERPHGRWRKLRFAAWLLVVGLSALAVAAVLRTDDPPEGPGREPAAGSTVGERAPAEQLAAAVAPAPAAPVPAAFIVRVSSVPEGAQAWVEGEPSPRGRTPVDLTFVTPGPKSLRLVAPGFRPRTLSIVAGTQKAARAVLVRISPPSAVAPRRGDSQPAPQPRNHYQPVGD